MKTLLEVIKLYNGNIAAEWSGIVPCISNLMESEDLNIWAGREVLLVKHFEEYIDLRDSYSDHYKDVNGFRPNFHNLETLSEYQKAYASLSRALDSMTSSNGTITYER